MRYYDKHKRNHLVYKMKLWFLRVTFRDIVSYMKNISLTLLDFVMIGIGFLIIFILPHLFH